MADKPTPQLPSASIAIYSAGDQSEDHFMQRDGLKFAGEHFLVDLWQAQQLNDLQHMEKALREAVKVAGATLLHIHLHHFTSSGGISGVAVLAESHISVHSWPQRNFAAFDIFMCGDTQPVKAVEVLKQYFKPQKVEIKTIKRGLLKLD